MCSSMMNKKHDKTEKGRKDLRAHLLRLQMSTGAD